MSVLKVPATIATFKDGVLTIAGATLVSFDGTTLAVEVKEPEAAPAVAPAGPIKRAAKKEEAPAAPAAAPAKPSTKPAAAAVAPAKPAAAARKPKPEPEPEEDGIDEITEID